MADFPKTGKIVIGSPETAARMAADPDFASRVFTMPGLPDNCVYVMDLDVINAFPLGPKSGEEGERG